MTFTQGQVGLGSFFSLSMKPSFENCVLYFLGLTLTNIRICLLIWNMCMWEILKQNANFWWKRANIFYTIQSILNQAEHRHVLVVLSHLVFVLVAHVFDDVVRSVHSWLHFRVQLIRHTSIILGFHHYTHTNTRLDLNILSAGFTAESTDHVYDQTAGPSSIRLQHKTTCNTDVLKPGDEGHITTSDSDFLSQ